MRLLPLVAAILLPLAASGQDALPDLQVKTVPRTAAETARIAAVTALATTFDDPEKFETMPGGATTYTGTIDADVFSHPSANISDEGELAFKVGNGLFRKLWVSAPSSTEGSDGLGPLFNARSCQSCHLKDSRGHPPGAGEEPVALFLRLSVPGGLEGDARAAIRDYIATSPDPVYGGQLQEFSLPGIPAEADLKVSYSDLPVVLGDGTTVTLRKPGYEAANLGYGPLAQDVMLSPRIAPQMIGLGLVEAIPAAEILAHADEEDADGDGISGRPNIVWSDVYGQPMLGRFGFKAGMPTIREQSAAAFSGDLGLGSELHPSGAGDCTEAEAACLAAPNGDGDGTEVTPTMLDLVESYSRNLAVPARRDVDDPQILQGKALFYSAGCADCHVPKFVTARLTDDAPQSFQLIWPYSDFLLHDMGDGLADHRPEARATGTEWRTQPLWGIGLTATVTGQQSFLHDGRARDVLEAILWHGGEAAPARDAVMALSPDDRAALLQFVESL